MAAERVTPFVRPLHAQDVLLVHDGPDLPGVAAAIEGLAASCKHVPRVADALDCLMHDPPRLLITALELPDQSGLELLAALDALFLDTEVLVVEPRIAPSVPPADLRNPQAFGSTTASSRIEQTILDVFAAPRPVVTHPRFLVGDFLRLAFAFRQSVDLRFRLYGGEPVQIEVVGGDLWNVFVGDLEGRGALAVMTAGAVVRNFEGRRLTAVPGRRQLDFVGSDALRWLGDGKGPATEPVEVIQVETHPSIDVTALGILTDPSEPVAPPDDGFDALFDAAMEAALSRDYGRAVESFEAALAIRPGDARARFNLDRIRRRG